VKSRNLGSRVIPTKRMSSRHTVQCVINRSFNSSHHERNEYMRQPWCHSYNAGADGDVQTPPASRGKANEPQPRLTWARPMTRRLVQ